MIWRRWAALCVLAATFVLPMLWVWFTGRSILVYAGWPLRYVWMFAVCLPMLRLAWMSPRTVAVGALTMAYGLSAVILLSLGLNLTVHPGWFVVLEAWQTPVYTWLGLLEPWYLMDRPGYLWALAVWTPIEATVVGRMLWRLGREPVMPQPQALELRGAREQSGSC